jgi:hypothetical protein
LSEFQAQVLRDRIERVDGKEGYMHSSYGSCSDLVIRPQNPSEHLDGKNLLHILMERSLTPNKERVAEILFERNFGNSRYKVFARDASWNADNGRYNRHWCYGTNSVLGAAVAGGDLDNVRYALSKGSTLSKPGDYLGNEFVDAVRWGQDAKYREIADVLLEAAQASGSHELLNQPYTDASGHATYPIEYFARRGDLAKVLKLASVGAAVPVKEARSATYRDEGIPLGPTHSANGVALSPPTTSRTRTEWWTVEVGRQSVPYIKQAVFNVNPDGRFFTLSADVYGEALEWLRSKGVLKPEDIPPDGDERFLNFVWSLHHAALEERASNPDFLAKSATFTDDFAKTVGRAKKETHGFRSVYRASPSIQQGATMISR